VAAGEEYFNICDNFAKLCWEPVPSPDFGFKLSFTPLACSVLAAMAAAFFAVIAISDSYLKVFVQLRG